MKNLNLLPMIFLFGCATPDQHQIELLDRALRDTPVREISQDLTVTPTPSPTPQTSAFDDLLAEPDTCETENTTLKETVEKLEKRVNDVADVAMRDMYRIFWEVIDNCPMHEKCYIPDYQDMKFKVLLRRINRESADEK